MPGKINLLGEDLESLKVFFQGLGEKPFRAKQILQWIHQRKVCDFRLMTDLSQGLRKTLELHCCISAPEIVKEEISKDGTRKWLLSVPGKSLIETVYIPEKKRGTLCISSQVGCALNCSFCYTARQGFARNLLSHEIIGQLWQATKQLKDLPITNVVMMGMGEPLLNFDEVVKSLAIMREDHAYGIARRRVTVSTSGVVPEIERLAISSDVALAISLHAPNDELRNQLVPLNKKYPIAELIQAGKNYTTIRKGLKITIEYVMLAGVNDTLSHAKQLVKVLQVLPCKINLIPFNFFSGAPFKCSDTTTIIQFAGILKSKGFITTVRATRGDDINAACGQLAGDIVDRTRRSRRYFLKEGGRNEGRKSYALS
jgi:23S rRNA (adenine2503-C2)-methyltransferase